MNPTLEPLHRGGADRQLFPILYVPYDALRPQVRPQSEEIPGMLHDLLRYSSRRRYWSGALRQPGNTVPFPHPSNGPRTGNVGPELLLYLIGTLGRIAFARRDDLPLPRLTEPVIGPLWPGRMILEGFAHRRQRARAKFVKVYNPISQKAGRAKWQPGFDANLPPLVYWKSPLMRTTSAIAKSSPSLNAVIAATKKLWRQYHLTYDQTHYVAKEVRRALAIERPKSCTRVVARLSREEERKLITYAYRTQGIRGLLIKTLFQTGASSRSSRRRQPMHKLPSGSIRICSAILSRRRSWSGACPWSRSRSSWHTPNWRPPKFMRNQAQR